mmetsp:Transcript_61948/g.72442  ORF Transcript_61948/g.72442 Transcript_61948/m.72442 type:complete len:551 (+) Transcript_61948:282-1934(+)
MTVSRGLDVLQREYRNMEVNRRAFAEESEIVLRKQQQTMEKMRKEKSLLKADLSGIQKKSTFRMLTPLEKSQMDRMYLEVDKFKSLIENERSRIQKMEDQVSQLKAKIWNKRKTMGGIHAARDNQKVVEKQVRILENRLEQALVKFNKSLSENRKLRQEIDDLRGERIAFESVQKKLEKEMREKKEDMANVINQSNAAYEQRDKAQIEMAAVEQEDKKEDEIFDRKMNEMNTLLEEELCLSSKRISTPSWKVLIEAKEAKKQAEKQKNMKNETNTEKEQKQIRRERMQNFEDAFRKIAASTGIHDVEELVRIFIANEEQNFSLFTYANEQANDIERLEGKINDLRDEETRNANESGNDMSQYNIVMHDLEKKFESNEAQSTALEEKCDVDQATFNGLRTQINALVHSLKCKSNIPGTVSVTEGNMLHYLGLIEQRTNELLSMYHSMKSFDQPSSKNIESASFSSTNILGAGPSAPMGTEPIHVNPPKLADYSSDDQSVDDGDGKTRPFSLKEIKGKTASAKSQRKMKKGSRKSGRSRRASLIIESSEAGH